LAAQANRRFFDELSGLILKPVIVEDTSGESYEGTLLGYDSTNLSLSLGDVKIKGELVHRVFLMGQKILKIMASERPFNLVGLKERLERVFPNMIQMYSEAGVLVVMGKIRVNATGVLEGTGPAADRVRDIYQRYVNEMET
jgi:small nuclear ribonucleoprotein (snRNP)-like protein